MKEAIEYINLVGEAAGQDMFCGDPHKPGSRTEDAIKLIQKETRASALRDALQASQSFPV